MTSRGRAGSPLRAIPLSDLIAFDGRGVIVAVVDSGVNTGHPHIGGLREGASFDRGPRGRTIRGGDFADRIGHGTACAAAVREVLPEAGILAARVFGERLEAHGAQVAAAILWALDRGAMVVNLSLGILDGPGLAAVARACRMAARRGAAVVASRPEPPVPGRSLDILPEVIAAGGDPTCPPDRFRNDPCGKGFLACPYARPIPDIPRSANYRGPSLAAARMSGFSGKVLGLAGPLDTEDLVKVLARWALEEPQDVS
jgi:hypothetical protein